MPLLLELFAINFHYVPIVCPSGSDEIFQVSKAGGKTVTEARCPVSTKPSEIPDYGETACSMISSMARIEHSSSDQMNCSIGSAAKVSGSPCLSLSIDPEA